MSDWEVGVRYWDSKEVRRTNMDRKSYKSSYNETNANVDRLEKIVFEMASKMLTKDIPSNKEETENSYTTDNELNEKALMLKAVYKCNQTRG